MLSKTATARGLDAYVCPTCKLRLRQVDESLECRNCSRVYPVVDGIPDFVVEDLSKNDQPIFRQIMRFDRFARFYESRMWYPVVLNLFGGFRSTTLAELVREISAIVMPVHGVVVDIACGPGTYGRHVASPTREVFGIDTSMNMLRQGAVYTATEGAGPMHFARAKAEVLPFEDRFFDGALCCGSLHLFADTVTALREIARTMKPAAPLAAMTFTPGGRGVFRFRTLRERIERKNRIHVFGLDVMEEYLRAAGFEDFRPKTFGSILTFSAEARLRGGTIRPGR